jgi:hypothetical protein
VPATASSTTFPPAASEGDARRRRPGSRRSTSARTVYAGAELATPTIAADLSWAPGFQTVAVALFPGGRRQTTSRLPGRRHLSSERADLRSPWAARFDGQRGRRQAARDLSRFRGLSRLRLLASPTSPGPFATFRAPAPATSSRAAVTRRAAAGRGPGAVATSALTADLPQTLPPSAGVGAAIPADVAAAVEPSSVASATGTATDVRATAAAPPSPADIRTKTSSQVLHLSLREDPTQPHLLTGRGN